MKLNHLILAGVFLLVLFLAGCTLGGQAISNSNTSSIGSSPKPVPAFCNDGTPTGKCSATKPLFCNNGKLQNRCSQCGCDQNNTCDANTQACVFPPRPDLTVNSAIVTNSTAHSVNFRITLSNIGQAAVTGTWTDRYEVYTLSNQLVAFQNVGGLGGPLLPGNSYVDYANFTNLPTGNYNLYAVADIFNQINESNENNNSLTQPFTLTDSNVSLCGNGVIDANEQCDGNNLAGQTCQSLGHTGGSLSCNPTCTFNTAACTDQNSNRPDLIGLIPNSFHSDANGWSFDYNLVIKNIGTATASGTVQVAYWTDFVSDSNGNQGGNGTQFGCTINLLPSQQKSCFFTNQHYDFPGTVRMQMWTDVTNVILESNENNNQTDVNRHIP